MTKQDGAFNISDLPLSDKIDTPTIFSLLGLPASSNLAVVRKTYYKKVEQLEKEKMQSKNEQEIAKLDRSIRSLESTFNDFSKNLEKTTKDLADTKRGLDGLKLDGSATWDTIQERYDSLVSTTPPERTGQLHQHFNSLKEKKGWFTKDEKFSNKTLYAGLGIMAASGISLAAASQFTDTPITELLSNWLEKASSSAPETSDVSVAVGADKNISIDLTAEPLAAATAPAEGMGLAADPVEMQEYIDANLTFEDDLLSTMGLIPDIHDTLGVNFKVEMLQSLVKNI